MAINFVQPLISGLPLGDLTTAAPIAQQTIHTDARTGQPFIDLTNRYLINALKSGADPLLRAADFWFTTR